MMSSSKTEELHEFTGDCAGVHWALFIDPSRASLESFLLFHELFLEGGKRDLLYMIITAGSK